MYMYIMNVQKKYIFNVIIKQRKRENLYSFSLSLLSFAIGRNQLMNG